MFKLSEIDLGPGEEIELSKTQLFKDFSTRKHYSGKHVMQIVVNGKPRAESAFDLVAGGTVRTRVMEPNSGPRWWQFMGRSIYAKQLLQYILIILLISRGDRTPILQHRQGPFGEGGGAQAAVHRAHRRQEHAD